jgi:spore coat polysaccharide biosynthesis protein SpsF
MAGTGVRTGILLQVRLNSKRLPNKALLPLINGNVIQHAMRSLKQVRADVHALITDKHSLDGLRPFARMEGFEIFPGPCHNVLKRYCMAAEHFAIDRIVRATGDNPLVSYKLTELTLQIQATQGLDLCRFLGEPLGTGVEVVSKRALDKALAASKDPYEQEHITTYILRNKDNFTVKEPICAQAYYLPQIRVTLDTKTDYQWILHIYNNLYKGEIIQLKELVRWLKKNLSTARSLKQEIETGEFSLSRP